MTDCIDKAALRTELRACRTAIAPPDRAAWEMAIQKKLFDLPAWRNARLVCGYMSTRGEIDLLPVWREAACVGKTYALPVTLTGADGGDMLFRATPAFEPASLVAGRFGIAEPPDAPHFPALTPAELDGALILVPGLGFDRDGYRIGYGGGYYDRYLTVLRRAGVSVTAVGLCFSVCRRPTLPREAHDHAVDFVIDERSESHERP